MWMCVTDIEMPMQLCKPTAMSMYLLLNPHRCEIYTFWTEFFIFAILQSVDDNDQRNVFHKLKPRDQYASPNVTFGTIEKLYHTWS